MSRSNTNRPTVVLAVLGILCLLLIAGCGRSSDADGQTTTAKDDLSAASSALSTMAPDAKLLVVQTAAPVNPSVTPAWSYMFGSPKSGKLYAVTMNEGKVMHATETGPAGLDEKEWADVPDSDSWPIDSDEAYDAALKASGIKGVPRSYTMLLETYVPASARGKENPTKALVWYVGFEAETGSGEGSVVQVDAKSGEVIKD